MRKPASNDEGQMRGRQRRRERAKGDRWRVWNKGVQNVQFKRCLIK